MRFSIIIPAYNVEKYISQCLKSVLEQSIRDYEIIIVYDKSSDRTKEVIEEYNNIHNVIRIIYNEEKQGLSYARNLGVSNAIGDYLVFLDGDDYLDKEALRILCRCIEDYRCPDWIYGNGNYIFREKQIPVLSNHVSELDTLSGLSGIEMLSEFVKHRNALWSVWGKAYKKSFWEGLNCISNKPCREDVDMGYKIIEHASITAVVPAFYYYRKEREGSLLNTYSYKRELIFNDVMREWLDYLKNDVILDNKLKESILRRLNDEVCRALIPKIYYAKGEEREDLINRGKHIRVYLDYPFGIINRLIQIFDKIFGFRATCFVLGGLKKLKYGK